MGLFSRMIDFVCHTFDIDCNDGKCEICGKDAASNLCVPGVFGGQVSKELAEKIELKEIDEDFKIEKCTNFKLASEHPIEEKKKRGRPRNIVLLEDGEKVKKKRGRPRKQNSVNYIKKTTNKKK